jgi:benzylsuccinate CoA-transferase BbsF subunit
MPPQATGNRHPQAAPHGIYRCAGDDRWIAITVMNDEYWRAFVEAIEQPELARDERFPRSRRGLRIRMS